MSFPNVIMGYVSRQIGKDRARCLCSRLFSCQLQNGAQIACVAVKVLNDCHGLLCEIIEPNASPLDRHIT